MSNTFNPHLTVARTGEEAQSRLSAVGADAGGIKVMAPRMRYYCIKLERVPAETARTIKRELLALGAEAAMAGEALHGQARQSDLVLMGTLEHYRTLSHRLRDLGPELAGLAAELEAVLIGLERDRFELQTPRGVLVLGERPALMGIINVTPDSFYDGGRCQELEPAVERGRELWQAGAQLLDVGGESTRPAAAPVPEDEELKRVIPVIERLAAETPALVSVDTQKPKVARKAVAAGAAIINDVSALSDPAMAEAAADTGAALVLMHMQGTPRTMQQNPHYDDLFGEIIAYLRERVERALAAGVARDRIIVDPGLGFGKTVEHNLELIRDLHRLRSLGLPILLGPSNKSFIGKVLGGEPDDRAEGTAAVLVAGVLNGAQILRVHDVAGMKRFVDMAGAIKNCRASGG